MSKPRQSPFPKIIYVSIDENSDDENCLLAWPNFESVEEGEKAARYELVDVGVHRAVHIHTLARKAGSKIS